LFVKSRHVISQGNPHLASWSSLTNNPPSRKDLLCGPTFDEDLDMSLVLAVKTFVQIDSAYSASKKKGVS
jgi:hypothetical protein